MVAEIIEEIELFLERDSSRGIFGLKMRAASAPTTDSRDIGALIDGALIDGALCGADGALIDGALCGGGAGLALGISACLGVSVGISPASIGGGGLGGGGAITLITGVGPAAFLVLAATFPGMVEIGALAACTKLFLALFFGLSLFASAHLSGELFLDPLLSIVSSAVIPNPITVSTPPLRFFFPTPLSLPSLLPALLLPAPPAARAGLKYLSSGAKLPRDDSFALVVVLPLRECRGRGGGACNPAALETREPFALPWFEERRDRCCGGAGRARAETRGRSSRSTSSRRRRRRSEESEDAVLESNFSDEGGRRGEEEVKHIVVDRPQVPVAGCELAGGGGGLVCRCNRCRGGHGSSVS